jgi:hypothetical protein
MADRKKETRMKEEQIGRQEKQIRTTYQNGRQEKTDKDDGQKWQTGKNRQEQ